MSEYVMVVFNVFIVFGSIVFVIKTLSDNHLRKKVLEKGMVDENIKSLFAKEPGQFFTGINAIKWGMVLIGVGFAVIVGRFFPYQYQEEATWGLAMVMAGLAFIIYYIIYKKTESDAK